MDPTPSVHRRKKHHRVAEKRLFSVTESTVGDGFNDSMMLQLLNTKRKNPKSSGSYYPEADNLTCSENGSELAKYLEKHPNNGMPFGFPPLKPEEFDLVAGWLISGTKGPTPAEQSVLEASKPEDAAEVRKWETFFNQDDPKHAMTARYNLRASIPCTHKIRHIHERILRACPLRHSTLDTDRPRGNRSSV